MTKNTHLVKILGQSILSLLFNLGAMLAGTLLALYLDVFSITSWALLLYPGILSIRGAIGGLFSGRLSTALHVGTIQARFTKNTRYFNLLLYVVILLTLESSIMMVLSASLFGKFFLGITALDSLTMLAVTMATMGLSLVFISPITMRISVLSFKKGLDPDVIVYPVISTLADIIVTFCYIVTINSFFSFRWGRNLVLLFDLLFLLLTVYILIKNYAEKELVKTLKEFFLTLLIVAFLVNITGTILHKISNVIAGKPEIYVVYPSLIDTVGAVGSIIGSTATTKLALGMLSSSLSSIRRHLVEVGCAWIASLIMFNLYAIIVSILYGLPGFQVLIQLLLTNFLAVSVMIFISFYIAIFTHKRGWDPDNFVIPIESSIADSITTISLFVALTLII